MPGPCSLPNGSSRMEYSAMWDMVCDLHKDCTPDSHRVFDKRGDIIHHVWVSEREWLVKRNKLRTGKTR